uniref:Uncharacterized protein n=1 Tax=Proboscia inermis TaxID=420281 RepID=A0A6T8JB03_9STRA|mmetsp:Transcript_27618/g.28019  ORF Transcript_27618/g.28019 Transcript_27618/m.28019 type:complete len:149 (+) Transcript_27618:266-712(+)
MRKHGFTTHTQKHTKWVPGESRMPPGWVCPPREKATPGNSPTIQDLDPSSKTRNTPRLSVYSLIPLRRGTVGLERHAEHTSARKIEQARALGNAIETRDWVTPFDWQQHPLALLVGIIDETPPLAKIGRGTINVAALPSKQSTQKCEG